MNVQHSEHSCGMSFVSGDGISHLCMSERHRRDELTAETEVNVTSFTLQLVGVLF